MENTTHNDKTTMEEAASEFKEHDFKYEAFISYRHLEPDSSAAEAVQKMIETFKVPQEFYVNGKKPVFRVFRDRDELTATYLSKSLEEALNSSKYLIVICSKRLKESVWCLKEVETFMKLRGPDYIIPVLIEGEPHESFPELLLQGEEKLAADLRPDGVKWPSFEGYQVLEKTKPEVVKELTKKSVDILKTEKYRIMAAILGVSYGDLKQRDKERRNKAMLRASIIASILLIFFGAFMFNAYRKENIAKNQVIQKNAQMIMGNAEQQLSKGNRVLALMYSASAMDKIKPEDAVYQELLKRRTGVLNDAANTTSTAIMSTIDTQTTGSNAVYIPSQNKVATAVGHGMIGLFDPSTGSPSGEALVLHKETVRSLMLSHNKKLLASGSEDNTVSITDTETMQEKGKIQLEGTVLITIFSPDDSELYILSSKAPKLKLSCYDLSTMKEKGPAYENVPGNVLDVSSNPISGKVLITFSSSDYSKRVVEYDMKTMKLTSNVPLEKENPVVSADYSTDGRYIYLLRSNGLFRYSTETGKTEVLSTGTSVSSGNEGNLIRTVRSRNELYFNDVSYVYVVDEKEWKLKKKYISNGIISSFNVSDDGTIISIGENGGISIVQNGILTDKKLDYGDGVPNTVSFSDDGKYAFFKSTTNNNMKIARLGNTENQTLEGNLIRASENGEYALVERKSDVAVISTSDQKDVFKVDRNNEFFKSLDILLPSDYFNSGSLSNDGQRYLRLINYKDNSGKFFNMAEVFDFKEGKVISKTDLGNLRPYYMNISPDGKEVIAGYQTGEIKIINAENSSVIRSFNVEPGFIQKIYFDGENRVAIAFENSGVIYNDVNDTSQSEKVAGKILSLTSDGYVSADGRKLSIKDKNGVTSRNLDERITRLRGAVDYKNVDTMTYNKNTEKIIAIFNRTEEVKAFLIDAKTGYIEKTYNLPSQVAAMSYGFASSDGKQVYFKGNYFSDTVDDKNYSSKSTVLVYPIMEYEELLKLEKEIVKDRKLTDEEKQVIGLE